MPTAVAKISVSDEASIGVKPLHKDVPAANRFSDPANFINRELSWLEFNRRVLEEAQDPTQPLIERVKFLSIFSSNLDEFFEIRVAGIKQQMQSETSEVGPDGLSPTDTFNRIQKTVRELVAVQCGLWKNELLPELGKNGIYVREIAELPVKRAAWAQRYFQQEVLPMLTPLAVDASHPFPHLLNRSHNLLVQAKAQRGGEPLHAIVQVPRAVARLIALPLYRRRRSGKPIAHHRAGTAPLKPRKRRPPRSGSRLSERCSRIAAEVFRPDRGGRLQTRRPAFDDASHAARDE